MKKTILYSLLLILIGFAVYSSCLSAEWLYWDDTVLARNNELTQALNLENIKLIFKDNSYIYCPLTVLTFAVEKHFFGNNDFWYHLNNIILHLAVCLLIFIFIKQLNFGTRTAYLTTILFCIHPIHMESVAWIAERKDVLYAFFYMGSVISYVHYIKRQDFRLFWLSVFLGLLSILSKPMALSLPLILLLIDWLMARKYTWTLVFEKIVFLSFIVPIAWQTFSAVAETYGRSPGAINWNEAPLVWAWTFGHYIRYFFIPVDILPIFELPEPFILTSHQVLANYILFSLTLIILFLSRKNRVLVFSILWFFLSMFFMFRFDNYDWDIVAPRFMYLGCLGFCLLIGIGTDLVLKWKVKSAIPIMVIFTFLILKTATSNIWTEPITFWNTVEKRVVADKIVITQVYFNRMLAYSRADKSKEAVVEIVKLCLLLPDLKEKIVKELKKDQQESLYLTYFDPVLTMNVEMIEPEKVVDMTEELAWKINFYNTLNGGTWYQRKMLVKE